MDGDAGPQSKKCNRLRVTVERHRVGGLDGRPTVWRLGDSADKIQRGCFCIDLNTIGRLTCAECQFDRPETAT